MFCYTVGDGVMSFDVSKFLNKARDFKKANPDATEYDFLNSDSYYKNLCEYDRKFALKHLIKIFEQNIREEDRQTIDNLQCCEEIK